MAGINNKYDYRDGVLTALGVEHTPSDVRNEDEYRKKVLDGFGVEYTDDDINRKHLYREKVVSGLASAGGGGSSDFSTAEVTIATTRRLGVTYHMEYTQSLGNNLLSLIINDDGSLFTDYDDKIVTDGHPDTYNILFTQNGYIEVFTPTPGNIVVEGNGEVLTESIEGEETTFVRVYGDCTITFS